MEQVELTIKEKIVLVIRESIRSGKETNFIYDIMFEKHKEVWAIQKLSTTIEEQIKLFNNIDESSELFKNIYETAKLALRKLQNDEGYNFYSAELILKINMLEDIFARKLRPIGTRIVEQTEKKKHLPVESQPIEAEEYDKENDLREIKMTYGGKFISSKTTGRKFNAEITKRKTIVDSLNNASL